MSSNMEEYESLDHLPDPDDFYDYLDLNDEDLDVEQEEVVMDVVDDNQLHIISNNTNISNTTNSSYSIDVNDDYEGIDDGNDEIASTSFASNSNSVERNVQLPVMDGRMSPKKSKPNQSHPINEPPHQLSPTSSTSSESPKFSDYILGTLIVRVVAARDLKPAMKQSGQGLTKSLREVIMKKDGKPKARINSSNSTLVNHHNHYQQQNRYHDDRQNNNRRRIRSLRGNNFGTSNPYATLSFANQTEITSTVYDTLNPSFPRHEQAYFDVSLPITHLAHEHQKDQDERKKKCLENDLSLPPPPQPPILNVVMKNDDSNIDEISPLKKKPLCNNHDVKKHNNIIDDDKFLGMASIDVTQLITGKVTFIDEWLTLHPTIQQRQQQLLQKQRNGGSNNKKSEELKDITGQIRIICEYDMTDLSPRPGDLVRFNGFVKPMDVYPLPMTQIFRVDNVGDSSNGNADEDLLVLSYRSKREDWYCTFIAHRFMFISVERHVTAVERYQDEIIDVVSKIVSSPALHTVQKTVNRLPEEGLLFMGLEASFAGLGLAGRWMKGGVGTMVDDIVYATNLDGKSAIIDVEEEYDDGDLSVASSNNDRDDDIDSLQLDENDLSLDADEEINQSEIMEKSATVNQNKISASTMPCCPITGQPMKEPVVAADGHSYEKKAIARWLRTSNISPMTGQELPHKELVPNYLLISTFGQAS